jgi:hypothetical protein
VRGEYPPARDAMQGSTGGPIYYGPDARVMFTPWFLDAHCYRIDAPRFKGDTMLVVRFKPAKKGGPATLSGRFEFDRASLELKLLVFAFSHVPRWVPDGTGGAIRFARLDEGAWVPAWWRMRAPVPTVDARKRTYQFYGYLETGGYTVTVLRPGRKDDDAIRRALQAVRDLGPPPP